MHPDDETIDVAVIAEQFHEKVREQLPPIAGLGEELRQPWGELLPEVREGYEAAVRDLLDRGLIAVADETVAERERRKGVVAHGV